MILLGVSKMNEASAETERTNAHGDSDLDRALSELKDALAIIDALDLSLDIGALLQEVINRLSNVER